MVNIIYVLERQGDWLIFKFYCDVFKAKNYFFVNNFYYIGNLLIAVSHKSGGLEVPWPPLDG